MIASVVATLCDDAGRLGGTIAAMRSSPQIDVGQFTHRSRRIPMTIDSPNQDQMKFLTRWLQERPGVSFIDVVFVHFENSQVARHTATDS